MRCGTRGSTDRRPAAVSVIWRSTWNSPAVVLSAVAASRSSESDQFSRLRVPEVDRHARSPLGCLPVQHGNRIVLLRSDAPQLPDLIHDLGAETVDRLLAQRARQVRTERLRERVAIVDHSTEGAVLPKQRPQKTAYVGVRTRYEVERKSTLTGTSAEVTHARTENDGPDTGLTPHQHQAFRSRS